MSKDIDCPYCGHYQNINHDDGHGYEEDTLHEMNCEKCDKNFAFTTSIIFHYDSYKADCLNGSKHKYEAQICYPKEFTKMCCSDCGDTRKPTEEEMKLILNK